MPIICSNASPGALRACTSSSCNLQLCLRSAISGPSRCLALQRTRRYRYPTTRLRLARWPSHRHMPVARSDQPLMRPGFAAPEGEMGGIGNLPMSRSLGFDHLVGNAPALAIGDRVFLGLETQRELLFHVAGRGPAHQRLDRPRLLGFVIQLPFPGLGTPRLHRVFGRLKNACGHGWWDPVRYAKWRRLEETAGIV